MKKTIAIVPLLIASLTPSIALANADGSGLGEAIFREFSYYAIAIEIGVCLVIFLPYYLYCKKHGNRKITTIILCILNGLYDIAFILFSLIIFIDFSKKMDTSFGFIYYCHGIYCLENMDDKKTAFKKASRFLPE